MSHEVLQPDGWAKPAGFSNGMAARGRLVFVAGQIGWNAQAQFETDDFVAQVRQALQNVVAVLAVAGAEPRHMTAITWYFTDRAEYLANLSAVGKVYREAVGRHFPTMVAVQVVALMEARAKVEIQAMAVVPD